MHLGRAVEKTHGFTNEIFNQNYLYQQLKKGVTTKQLEAKGFDYLLTDDKIIIPQFANHLLFHNAFSRVVAGNMQEVKLKAEGLLIFLKKEYDIE